MSCRVLSCLAVRRPEAVETEGGDEGSGSGSGSGSVWEELQDDDGDTYYFNTETEETSWTKPDGFGDDSSSSHSSSSSSSSSNTSSGGADASADASADAEDAAWEIEEEEVSQLLV